MSCLYRLNRGLTRILQISRIFGDFCVSSTFCCVLSFLSINVIVAGYFRKLRDFDSRYKDENAVGLPIISTQVCFVRYLLLLSIVDFPVPRLLLTNAMKIPFFYLTVNAKTDILSNVVGREFHTPRLGRSLPEPSEIGNYVRKTT